MGKQGVKTVKWPVVLRRAQQLAYEISPDYATARAFVDIIEESNGLSEREKTKQLMYGIVDGLQYGNWPKERVPKAG